MATHQRSVGRRMHLYLRVVLIMCIVTAPVLVSRLDGWRWNRLMQRAVPGSTSKAIAAAPLRSPETMVARYFAARSDIINGLLPAGAGGLHVVDSLPDATGEAFPRTSTIVLVASDDVEALTSTEVHERAHLLYAREAPIAQRIIRSLPAPIINSYAATNDREHFAEMARSAWDLLRPAPLDMAEGVAHAMASAEELVPGTAGFVSIFVRHQAFATRRDATWWADAAVPYVAPSRAEWELLTQVLEAQRQPDATLAPWPVPSMREWVDQHRATGLAEGGVIGYLHAMSFWPSAMLLRVLD